MVEETGTKCKIINKLGITIEGRKSPGEEIGLLQVSYGYSAEVIGNKGKPQLTTVEQEHGYEVIWLSIENAYKIITNSNKSLSYEASFTISRDLAFLKKYQKGI